jgi:hypothetical protein
MLYDKPHDESRAAVKTDLLKCIPAAAPLDWTYFFAVGIIASRSLACCCSSNVIMELNWAG